MLVDKLKLDNLIGTVWLYSVEQALRDWLWC